MITEENKNRLVTLEGANSLYGDLRGRILDVRNSLGGEIAKKVNKEDLTSALIYKGSVDNYSNLPSNAATGDVYNVKNANGSIPAGTNYAWTGTEWDALGGAVTVDLSGYVQGSIATYEGEESDIVKMMNSVKNPT